MQGPMRRWTDLSPKSARSHAVESEWIEAKKEIILMRARMNELIDMLENMTTG
jgi:hypothetical protein